MKFENKLCSNKMTFQECELAILRDAIDINQKKVGEKKIQSPEIQDMIRIVEEFLYDNPCICYGGTAINNILPDDSQFYDRTFEMPDYDFFSENALNHAKELADLYFKQGYMGVEAKAGVHEGW